MKFTKHGINDGANTYWSEDGAFYITSHLWLSHPKGANRRGVRTRIWEAFPNGFSADTKPVVTADSLKSLKTKIGLIVRRVGQ